jgi:hypothetical protein
MNNNRSVAIRQQLVFQYKTLWKNKAHNMPQHENNKNK